MASANVAERALALIDWSSLRAVGGDGEGVQRAIEELLLSESGEAAQRAYWGIENHAFVQGELFEVSGACSSVLIASLADPREKWVRVAVLELIFQIICGHASASPGTPADIVQRCRRVVREGLWLLYREAICGERDAALDVLEQLGEGERARRLLSTATADATHARRGRP
ncbi:uncharacterized protein SOCE26_082020 [Sorangium cellulosum]|uniref:Uncharacterized protein n=1 Tax=Sorangium cellulosum TaxID=56 RepID=A0A2L0F542_SORCE|nr:uncharacterized protein SOCE26_082020 [Sorangium cellulosum]